MKKENLQDVRHDYSKFKLDEDSIEKDPFRQFKLWMQDAMAGDFPDPNAMVVSTCSNSRPSSRVVLLKSYDERGFVFYTNYESKKGLDIAANPNIAAIFFWDKFERQIRIEGRAEKISPEESFEYYKTRPYASRLGAWASKQSQPLSSRFKLMREVAKLMARYPVNVPLPPFWGGYRIVPDYFEFWQGRPSRLHDRFAYTHESGEWRAERLSP